MIPLPDSRLSTAAQLIAPCEAIADIGADHGKLSLFLLYTKKCRHVYVTDISRKSLNKAQALFARNHFDDKASFICDDGLNALRNAAVQAVVICGMGGKKISEILQNGERFLNKASLILSPQTDAGFLRETICSISYRIDEEILVVSQKRFYTVLRCVYTDDVKVPLTPKELTLGSFALKNTDPLTLSYLLWRKDVEKCRIAEPNNNQVLFWIDEEINRIRCAALSSTLQNGCERV